jgi:hypothetical protein
MAQLFLPPGKLPPNYGDLLRAAGLNQGVSFGGSEIDVPEGLTPEQQAQYLTLANPPPAAAPMFSNADLAKFLAQQNGGTLPDLPNVSGDAGVAPGETGPGVTTTGLEGGRASANPAFNAIANPFGKSGLDLDPTLATAANLGLSALASAIPGLGQINQARGLVTGVGKIGDLISDLAFGVPSASSAPGVPTSPDPNSPANQVSGAELGMSFGPNMAQYGGRTGAPSETGATGQSSTGVPYGGPGRSPDLTSPYAQEQNLPGFRGEPPATNREDLPATPPPDVPTAPPATPPDEPDTSNSPDNPEGTGGTSGVGGGAGGTGGTGTGGGNAGDSGAPSGGDSGDARGGFLNRRRVGQINRSSRAGGVSFRGAPHFAGGGNVTPTYYQRAGVVAAPVNDRVARLARIRAFEKARGDHAI